MRNETFDDFTSSEQANQYEERKPFQFREEPTNEEATHKWLMEEFEEAIKLANSRIRNFVEWSYLYKGVHWRNIGRSSYRSDYGSERESRKPKMVDNFIWEFIDHKVSQMSRLGTNIACIPWNDEQSDVNNAKSCEKLLTARFIDMGFDEIQDEADRIKFKYGTVFQIPTWNKEIGPIHNSYKELEKIYKGDIPKHILKKLKKDQAFRIGDVDLVNAMPWEVFPETHRKEWKTVDHYTYVPEWMSVHEARAKWPKKAALIQANKRSFLDFEDNVISYPEDRIQVKHTYHRKTEYLPEGAHIIWCDDCILEWNALPYSHGELPLVVDRDIAIEKELFGRPKIQNIEQMQRQSNNIESAIGRDLGAGSAPKWLFPKGAVTFKSATNDLTIMEYKGAKEPKLVQNNPVSQQAVQKLDRNEKRMAKLMKVFDVSRGQVPPGIEANSALRFLDEQEDQANETDKKGRKNRVIKSARQMVSIMGQYYDESDDRTSRILGKNNDYMIENLKDADFMKVYDVQFQNTSALPDTKTGKIATIVDMNMATQTDPVFKTPQIVKMLDLAQDEAFVDRTTASTNTANTIFEMLTKGKPVEEPQMHDDLIIYYEVFYQRIQDFGFKKRIQGEIREAVYNYIEILEGLLWQKSKVNPKIQAALMTMDYFPCFFMPDIPDPTMMQPDYVGKESGMQTDEMENTQEAINQNVEQSQGE